MLTRRLSSTVKKILFSVHLIVPIMDRGAGQWHHQMILFWWQRVRVIGDGCAPGRYVDTKRPRCPAMLPGEERHGGGADGPSGRS